MKPLVLLFLLGCCVGCGKLPTHSSLDSCTDTLEWTADIVKEEAATITDMRRVGNAETEKAFESHRENLLRLRRQQPQP